MELLQQALSYLEQEPLLNIDMLEAIRRNKADILAASEKGALLYHTAAAAYMMSAEEQGTARDMLSLIPKATLFAAHQPLIVPLAEKALNLKPSLVCVQAAYLKKEPVAMDYEGVRIKRLDQSHFTFIRDWYTHGPDEDYLLERLGAGVLYGAYAGGELAGFIGEHAEGSIGMLEILPQYRRRGLGEKLEAYRTNAHLRAGYVPFGQILTGNTPSLGLQKKLGYTVSEDTVVWLQ
ncbi:MAG TPA: GNAT family N-acetyltransferase [Feifaniaceae bacterium]|nr:GNAT family N-acetyltransferase [Feifaniaceae bacterium]